jgi:hypothetical protein
MMAFGEVSEGLYRILRVGRYLSLFTHHPPDVRCAYGEIITEPQKSRKYVEPILEDRLVRPNLVGAMPHELELTDRFEHIVCLSAQNLNISDSAHSWRLTWCCAKGLLTSSVECLACVDVSWRLMVQAYRNCA